MGSTSVFASLPQPAALNMSMLAHGDAKWAERAIQPRETDVAVAWPEGLMQAFSARMVDHGIGINHTQMMCDRRYAVQQLMAAYTLLDGELHTMATQLFFHFEERQIRRPALH